MHSRNRPLESLYGFVNRRSRVQSAPPAQESRNTGEFGECGRSAHRPRTRLIRRLAAQVIRGDLTLQQADAALAVSR